METRDISRVNRTGINLTNPFEYLWGDECVHYPTFIDVSMPNSVIMKYVVYKHFHTGSIGFVISVRLAALDSWDRTGWI
jgi:hypothetical protein